MPLILTMDTRTRKKRGGTRIWDDLRRLALMTIATDTILRTLPTSNNGLAMKKVVEILVTVMLELLVQHLVTTALALAILRVRGWYPSAKIGGVRDGRQENFSSVPSPFRPLAERVDLCWYR